MGRRAVLLIVAVVIAALGAGMVYLYATGANNRAMAAQQPVQVLQAVSQISPGETLSSAQSAGKLQLGSVPKADVLQGAVNGLGAMGNDVALTTIYPGEQITTNKFGAPGDQSNLTIPKGDIAISVSLTDTGRVAGFVSPGNDVAVFVNTTATGSTTGSSTASQDESRLLLPKVQVIAIGATTTVAKTTTDTTSGTQTTEQLPNTLFTLAVNQKDAEKILYAADHGTLNFALLNAKSKVATGPGVTGTNLFK
jgi:pilus assembly protein CpaB